MWLHLVGTSRIYGQKHNNKKEAIHKNTNIHSLYETIINYTQYTVLFEKYAKMGGITAQWKLHAHRHIKSRIYNRIFMAGWSFCIGKAPEPRLPCFGPLVCLHFYSYIICQTDTWVFRAISVRLTLHNFCEYYTTFFLKIIQLFNFKLIVTDTGAGGNTKKYNFD
jgi:hypothetical protein